MKNKLILLPDGVTWVRPTEISSIKVLPTETTYSGTLLRARMVVDHGFDMKTVVNANDEQHAILMAGELAAIVNAVEDALDEEPEGSL